MTSPTATLPARTARLAVAVLVACSALVGVARLSQAAPTRAEVEVAQAELDALNQRFSLLVEQYNQARLRLQGVREELAEVRTTMRRASAEATAASEALEMRAVAAFTGNGSELGSILGAGSFSEFTDRLAYLGTIAEEDADLLARAEHARREAARAAAELEEAAEERARILADIEARTDEIRSAIADQQALVERYAEELAAAREARREAQRRAEEAAASNDDGGGAAPAPPGGGGGAPPPAPSPGAQAAIAAAYSVIGVRYTWGGSSPQTGFDCSGLTMWAWAHAGASLPHSSSAQYAALPKVDRSQLQPGDLVFFYSPISHVGLYIGGGQMIDAPHTGTVVQVRSISWDRFVGAARPG